MSTLRFAAIMVAGLLVAGLVSYLNAPPPPNYIELGTRPADPLLAPIVLAPPAERKPAADAGWIESGRSVRLTDLSGKVAMIHYWATWCAPCIAEMPRLDVLAKRLGGPEMAVVPISLDKEGAIIVPRFYQQVRLTSLPLALAAEGEPQPETIPYTLLIDKSGRVAWEGTGAHVWDSPEIEAKLRALLAE